MAKPSTATRIHSSYLDEVEDHAVRAIANANGLSPNKVIRFAVRALLGLPAPQLHIPDGLDELVKPR
jgi:hypothetical protein